MTFYLVKAKLKSNVADLHYDIYHGMIHTLIPFGNGWTFEKEWFFLSLHCPLNKFSILGDTIIKKGSVKSSSGDGNWLKECKKPSDGLY